MTLKLKNDCIKDIFQYPHTTTVETAERLGQSRDAIQDIFASMVVSDEIEQTGAIYGHPTYTFVEHGQ